MIIIFRGDDDNYSWVSDDIDSNDVGKKVKKVTIVMRKMIKTGPAKRANCLADVLVGHNLKRGEL